jgi:hypothetical protein
MVDRLAAPAWPRRCRLGPDTGDRPVEREEGRQCHWSTSSSGIGGKPLSTADVKALAAGASVG